MVTTKSHLYVLLFLSSVIPINSRVYPIDIGITYTGGSDDQIKGRLENSVGTQTEIFDLNDVGTVTECTKTTSCCSSKLCQYNPDLTDIGTPTFLFLMSEGNDQLWVDYVEVDNGAKIDWTGYKVIEYTDSDPTGCDILTVDLTLQSANGANQIPCDLFATFAPTQTTTPPTSITLSPTTATFSPTAATTGPTSYPTQPTSTPTDPTSAAPTGLTQQPTEVTAQPTGTPTSGTAQPTTTPTDATAQPTQSPTYAQKCYEIEIALFPEGGSVDEIWSVINGDTAPYSTDAMSLGVMSDGGESYAFDVCGDDVGNVLNAQLISYGDDYLVVTRVTMAAEGIDASETFGDYLSYGGSDSNGCAVLTADINDMTVVEQSPCTTIAISDETPSPITPSPTELGDIAYNIQITLLKQGGSDEDIYIVLEGTGGKTSAQYLGPMKQGGETYSFEIYDIDITPLDYAYLINFGGDALVVTDVVVNTVYTASETFGDVLEYENSNPLGCAVLTVTFGSMSMTQTDQVPCNIMAPLVATYTPMVTQTTVVGEIRYNVAIDLYYQGGSIEDIWIIIRGINGTTTPYNLGSMPTGGDTYYFQFVDVNVGSIQKAYLVNYGDDDLVVIDVNVNDNSLSEGELTFLEYGGNNPYGCAVLEADFVADSLMENDENPCKIIPFTQSVIAITGGEWRIYSVALEIYAQGGSVDDIFIAVEGINGDMIDFVNIGAMTSGSEVYPFFLNVTNVGIGAKLHIINYGDDALLVKGCNIDGNHYEENTFDTVEYTGVDPRGCSVLICDVITEDEMSVSDQVPCPNYVVPYPSNETTTYKVDIKVASTLVLNEGGSTEEFFIIIQGLNGRMTDPFSIGSSMNDEDRTYSFDVGPLLDIGDIKALYLITYGEDALAVQSITIGTYSVSETTGDLLHYEDPSIGGCAVLKADFLRDEMSTEEQTPCDIIPFFFPYDASAAKTEYFVAVDTTLVPTGGTEDDIWMKITNTADESSSFILLTGLEEDGDVYTFRKSISNLGQSLSKVEFIHFADDGFCIDYCQLNEDNIIDLGLIGYWCSSHPNDNEFTDNMDNEGCSILTCDFVHGEIHETTQSPCSHDVYGWNDKEYRVYAIVINVCSDAAGFIDTYSMNKFWVILSRDNKMSQYLYISDLGSDGDHIFMFNTTNIGVIDKLYLLHFNNDDVCIRSISVDGFTLYNTPFIQSEYDCEYQQNGCNVIIADFDSVELSIGSESECPFEPTDFNAEDDSCWDQKVDDWMNQLFDFASLVGIISGIVLIVLSLLICCCCIWCGYVLMNRNKQNGDATNVQMANATGFDVYS